jgi:hypothetical protein
MTKLQSLVVALAASQMAAAVVAVAPMDSSAPLVVKRQEPAPANKGGLAGLLGGGKMGKMLGDPAASKTRKLPALCCVSQRL